MRNLKKIYDAGLLVMLGTDSGATPIPVQGFAEQMELALMGQAGLTPLHAISVVAKNGAPLASPLFLSPSTHTKPMKCFLDLLKAIRAPEPKLTIAPILRTVNPAERCWF